MCIAILKKAGCEISKEALLNGWKANDDGAGFACVMPSGEFLMHTSMSWEGFYPLYQEAVELYGDTSDFLIHFRITSKGDTNLSNCHPFRVDADRVIIHNGTISNIHIAKDDKRSDTRVLAEDWLPNLPDNWEDNQIIKLFFEEFVGWSKVIMLHRTKGAYIFNEEKGHWFEGNWYSNDSYKTKAVTKYSDGYWDTIENRWVSWEEKRLQNESWLNKDTKKDAFSAWDRCKKCNYLCKEDELHEIPLASGEIVMWCEDCCDKYWDSDVKDCSYCGISFSQEQIAEYWNHTDGDIVELCLDCYEMLITQGIKLDSLEWMEEDSVQIVGRL